MTNDKFEQIASMFKFDFDSKQNQEKLASNEDILVRASLLQEKIANELASIPSIDEENLILDAIKYYE